MKPSLYNTKTRKKEPFEPITKGVVKLYTCGPTVYDYLHLGNLRAYIFADILKRVLLYNGLTVQHIMNITDVGHLVSDGDTGEDKLEKGARREGKSAWEVAKHFTELALKDFERLHIIAPEKYTKATDHIPEQIALVQKLEKNGYIYTIEDGVYYDTSKFPPYGDFAKLDVEEMKAGKRVEMVEGKRNITDFALWKFSPKDKKRDMEWDSPWGKGFPGWHIECSAMSMKYLGDHFDIHTGGIDHIPVHHTNEIAQNFGATGKDVVNFWMHNEFLVTPEGEKISKSAGNFPILQNLLDDGYDPLVYRFFALNTHYRKPLTLSKQALVAAREGLERLRQFVRVLKEHAESNTMNDSVEELLLQSRRDFLDAVNDDLNTPKALGAVFDLIKIVNKAIERGEELPYTQIANALHEFDNIFGLDLEAIGNADLPEEVMSLLQERKMARSNKEWQRSDEIREKLDKIGYIVQDTSTEQRVIRKTRQKEE